MKLKWWAMLACGGYLLIYVLTEWISRMIHGKVVKVGQTIVSIPIAAACLVISIMHPFITIAGTYLFIGMFAFGVPAIILAGVVNMGWWSLHPETIAFIVLALGSVLCSNYVVTKWIIRHFSFKGLGKLYLRRPLRTVGFLFGSSKKYSILTVSCLFYLVISGYLFIQSDGYLISESFDLAILKAILVFIAYTNMKLKAKETEMDAKELLESISRLFEHDKL